MCNTDNLWIQKYNGFLQQLHKVFSDHSRILFWVGTLLYLFSWDGTLLYLFFWDGTLLYSFSWDGTPH